MKNLNVLVAFWGGTAVGTVLGLLFAPEKGENTGKERNSVSSG